MAEARRIGLILGGGGVAGVWWELGVLAALQQHTGWNPASATVITGTSAGSMVGALTALGRDLDVLVDAEARGATIPDPPPASEARATTTSAVPQEFLDLLSPSGGPVIERAQKAGRLALDAEPPIDVTAYKEMMGSMVDSEAWPEGELWVTTVDCETGETVILDKTSGLDLTSAVAASCALPTYFPVIEHEGRTFTDGPRAPYVANVASELDLDALVFVGLKLPFLDGADEHVELDELERKGMPIARVVDGREFVAIAAELMDPGIGGQAALIGRLDGERAAPDVRRVVGSR